MQCEVRAFNFRVFMFYLSIHFYDMYEKCDTHECRVGFLLGYDISLIVVA